MDYRQAFAISAIGMSVERTRVDVAALNLANVNTVMGTDGAGYKPMRVVAHQAMSAPSFGTLVEQGGDAGRIGSELNFSVEPTGNAPRQVYEPGHPLANERGFVFYPNVDTATEMVTMMSAMRSYEANVAAMNTARSLAMKALEIGGNN